MNITVAFNCRYEGSTLLLMANALRLVAYRDPPLPQAGQGS
jgi:hypothetical protein